LKKYVGGGPQNCTHSAGQSDREEEAIGGGEERYLMGKESKGSKKKKRGRKQRVPGQKNY